jgi:hypothetical protein
VLESTLEPKSERQESRAAIVSVVTHRINCDTAATAVRKKPLPEKQAPAFLPALEETNDCQTRSGSRQAMVSDSTVNDVIFDPAAHFSEWLQALEDFRGRPQRESGPSVYLADGDPDLTERVCLDDQPPDEIRSEGTLVVTEYGTLKADIAVRVAVIDGIFKGKVSASERVILKNHGLVIGEINTPALTIHGGAIIEGRVYFQPPEEYFEPPVSLDAPAVPWEPPVFSAQKVGFARVWLGRIFQ